MRRMPSSARRNQTRRTQPVIEGLEHRRLMSHGSLGHSSVGGRLVERRVLAGRPEVHLHDADRRHRRDPDRRPRQPGRNDGR